MRGEEIGRIARAAESAPPDGPKGRTFLIQGAPGSGKTALIAELCRRLEVVPGTGVMYFSARRRPIWTAPPLNDAIAIGHRQRDEYYEDRLAASRTPLEIVAALHRLMAADSGARESDACRAIGSAARQLDPVTRKEWDTRFDAQPGKCFESLLRAGIVSLDSMYRCTSPVPSFSRYILRQVRNGRHWRR